MGFTKHVMIVVALAAAAGCGKKKDAPGGEPGTGTASAAGSAAASGSAVASGSAGSAGSAGSGSAGSGSAGSAAGSAAPAPTGPVGRDAPDNVGALVELAVKNESCIIDPYYPTNSCSAQVGAFEAAFDPTKDLPTVINLLEDKNAQVRYVAARTLADKMLMQTSPGRAYTARVLAAAKAETEPANATMLGTSLLQGDFSDKAYADAIGDLFEHHPLPAMRASLASNLAVQDEARWLPVMIKQYASESDDKTKVAIISGMYLARDAATVCPFLLAQVKHPNDDISSEAAYGIAWSDGKCKDSYDPFLTALGERLAATKPTYQYALKIVYMAQAKGATDEQKARFKKLLEPLVGNKELSGMTRAKFIEVIGDKAFAKGFVGDADKFVADAAKKLQK